MLKSLVLSLFKIIFAWEASLFRARYSGPVIAITGSVGKSSTKEVIGLVIRKAYGENVIITPKSLNTEIGVPLTMLGFKQIPSGVIGWLVAPFRGLMVALFGVTPKCMVLELGADTRGDIAYLARLTRPTHGVITNISEAHSALMGGLEEIRREKLSLLEFIAPDGVVVLNGDDPHMAKARVQPTQTKLLVRLHTRSDYFASGIRITLEGTEAVMHHANRTQRVRVQRYGEHHIYSVLFAAAIADSLEISPAVQLQAFKEVRPVPGRGMLLEGKRDSIIIDESYNAQPAAMRASLELLAQLPAKRKIAILGDMRELKEPDAIHREMGKLAHEYADYVIGVGPLSKLYKPDEWFMTSREAVPSALRQLSAGAIVLVKGSQNTIRLERLVKELMQSPGQAKKMLVRQDLEWLNRD